ncbi:MAG: helix-turn-helix domain-containing protein [Treponemataceae bacterium]|nr:helix-turn-helix domain-containing protein [Treponemataceae bacterium]
MFFSDEYISLLPGYSNVDCHKHPMLHIIVSEEMIKAKILGQSISARQLIIAKNIKHEIVHLPVKTIVLFIAPYSSMESELNKILKGQSFYTSEDIIPDFEGNEKRLTERVLNYWGIPTNNVQSADDQRVRVIIEKFSKGEWLSYSVSKIAEKTQISVSRLEHVFKNETGITLKQYMLMNRLRNVYRLAVNGRSLTEAALASGFNSSAHLSKTAYDMTGISISRVLERIG